LLTFQKLVCTIRKHAAAYSYGLKRSGHRQRETR